LGNTLQRLVRSGHFEGQREVVRWACPTKFGDDWRYVRSYRAAQMAITKHLTQEKQSG
jgi:hypothetical protein